MHTAHKPSEVIGRLIEWAERRPSVRAMLLTSTRAVPGAPVDLLSDYDVVLVVTEVYRYATDRSWIEDFGTVLVAYWDPLQPQPQHGIEGAGNVVQYADGLKIDFTLWPVSHLQHLVQQPALPAELDAGYTVLLDKDGLTAGMQPPSYRGYVPGRPSEEAFLTLINDFFSDVPYVAKCLWRDELLPAKWCLDYDMKYTYLLPMLEWRMEHDHGWAVPTGALGKGLKKRLPAELWVELEGTYAGAAIADNWQALERTLALFRRLAIAVAADLGYSYPYELDRRVTAYVRSIRDLARNAESGE